MDGVRFNFSHDSHENHTNKYKLVRETAKKLGHQLSILCDIQGPKIRVGKMVRPITFVKDQIVNVTFEECNLKEL
jgi:pyruvate kinase